MSARDRAARWLAQNDGHRAWTLLPQGLRTFYLDRADALLDELAEWLVAE